MNIAKVRVLIVALIVLVFCVYTLSSGITPIVQSKSAGHSGDSAFCKSYCKAHHKEHGGMGACVKWCKYYYFERA